MTRAEAIIREIARDRKRGATALAERALDALALSPRAGSDLLRVRPAMPLIAAVVRLARRRGVAAARRDLRERSARIVRAARDVMPPGARYIVFGGSGTVRSIVRASRGKIVEHLPADV